MKKFIFYLSAIALSVMATVTFASCTDDDDKDLTKLIEQETKETVLAVTPTNLSMSSKKGEKASFSIRTNSRWTISGQAEWLSISANSGDGDTQINLETLRSNESSEPRDVTLVVKAGDATQSITVTQEPGAKPLYIRIKDETIMSDGYYADLEFVGNVKGFHYACYYADGVKAWTDDDFKRDLETETAFSPDKYNYADYVLPAPNTNYVYVAVAYNDQKEYGPIFKHEFKSKSSSTSYDAFVGNFKQEATRWTFNVNMNAYCDSYYPCYITDDYSGNDATALAYLFVNGDLSSAFFARLIEESIKTQNMEPAKRDGSMQISRRSDQTAIFFWTWGRNAQNVFSGNIQWDYCNSYSSSRAPKRQAPAVDENGGIEMKADKPTIQEVKAFKNNIKVERF